MIDLNGSASGTGFAADFVAGGSAVRIVGAGLSITVPSGPALSYATIRIQNVEDGVSEILDANTSGTTIQKSYNAGVLRLQGTASKNDYEKVLRTVTYQNKATIPTLATRQINFVVNDGYAESNTAVSSVKMILLRLTLDISPASQTIAQGGTAVFSIVVRNTGSVALQSVQLRASLTPACNRTWNTINPNTSRTISCTVSNVQADFLNKAAVTGSDSSGNETTAEDTARVEVENPDIRIVKGPSTQTVLAGATARFSVFVLNPSARVNLGDVEVSDPLAPDCSREGQANLGNLAAGAQVTYECTLANVSAAFTNTIVVSGRNLFTGEEVSDSSIAAVELLDIATALQADPMLLVSPGGPVRFTLTLANSGTVAWTITELGSNRLGDLLDPDNSMLVDNECAAKPLAALPPQEQLNCSFSAAVSGPPGPYAISVLATAVDKDGSEVTKEAAATVTIANDSLLTTTLTASTNSLPIPGAYVEEQVLLRNTSGDTAVTVTALEHSQLNNLNRFGTCALPQRLPPGESYSCAFQVYVSGAVGTATRQSVISRGTSAAGTAVGGEAETTFTFYDPTLLRDLLPVIASNYHQPDEDNDSACSAYPLTSGVRYDFMIDDEEDWYAINVTRGGEMIVEVKDFISTDPQLIVYEGLRCTALNIVDSGFDGSARANKLLRMNVSPGMHYVRLINSGGTVYQTPYKLFVVTP